MNGIQSVDKNIFVVVSGAVLNRDMTQIIHGGLAQTCTFPRTVTIVRENTFKDTNVFSVRPNDGLEIVEHHSFSRSKVRQLVLPASVCKISESAFH